MASMTEIMRQRKTNQNQTRTNQQIIEEAERADPDGFRVAYNSVYGRGSYDPEDKQVIQIATNTGTKTVPGHNVGPTYDRYGNPIRQNSWNYTGDPVGSSAWQQGQSGYSGSGSGSSDWEDYLQQYQDMMDEYNAALQTQWQTNLADIDASYADQMSSLQGLLGSYGTLGSGIGGNVLGKGVADWARAKAGTVSDLNAQMAQNNLSGMQWMGDYGLQQQNFGLQSELGRGNLALGFGQLGLDQTLGLGNLALQGGQLGLDYTLGLGNLGLQQQQMGLQGQQMQNEYQLGMGQLGLQQEQMAQTAQQAEYGRQQELLIQQNQIAAQMAQLGAQLQSAAQDRSLQGEQMRLNAGVQMQQLAAQLAEIQNQSAYQIASLQLDRDKLNYEASQQQFANLVQLLPYAQSTGARSPIMQQLMGSLGGGGAPANPTSGGSSAGLGSLGMKGFGSTVTPDMMTSNSGRDLLAWNQAQAGEIPWNQAYQQATGNPTDQYMVGSPNFGQGTWDMMTDMQTLKDAGYGAGGQLAGTQSPVGGSMPADWGTQQARNNMNQFYTDASQAQRYASGQQNLASNQQGYASNQLKMYGVNPQLYSFGPDFAYIADHLQGLNDGSAMNLQALQKAYNSGLLGPIDPTRIMPADTLYEMLRLRAGKKKDRASAIGLPKGVLGNRKP